MRWMRYNGAFSRMLAEVEIQALRTIPGVIKLSPAACTITHDAGAEVTTWAAGLGVGVTWTYTGQPPADMPDFDTLPLTDEARTTIAPYQRSRLETHVRLRGGLVEWPCGTGKTFLGCAFVATAPMEKTLVVTKGSTTWQWVSQFRKWTTIPQDRIHVLEGRSAFTLERAPVGRTQRIGQWLLPKRVVHQHPEAERFPDLDTVLSEVPPGVFLWTDVDTEIRNGKTMKWLLKTEQLRVCDWTPTPRAGWRVRRADDTRVDNWRREIAYFDRTSTQDLQRVYPSAKAGWIESMSSPDIPPGEALRSRILYEASNGATPDALRTIVTNTPTIVWDPASTRILPEDFLDDVIGGYAAEAFARREEGVLPADMGNANIIITSWSVLAERRLALQGWGAHTIIVDEAHLGKDRRMYKKEIDPRGHGTIDVLLPTQAAAIAILCDQASVRRVLAMTATPLQDRPRDMYAILRMLDPTGVGGYSAWSSYFCAAFKDTFAWNDKGSSHEAELAARISQYRTTVTKAEAFAALPRMRVEVVNIPQSRLLPRTVAEMKEERQRARGTKIAYLHWKLERAAASKTPYLVERAQDYTAEGGKVVLLTGTIEHAQQLHAAIQAVVACPVYLGTGEDSSIEDRRAMVAAFTAGIEGDESPAVLIGTLAAWCEGIDGLQGVHHVLVAMIPWNLLLIQMLGRYERLGAVRGSQVEIVVAEGTVDEEIIAKVLPKYKAAVAILNSDDADRVHNELLGHIEDQDADVLAGMADLLLSLGATGTQDEDED